MIFVTVGMHPQRFDRLIRKMDELARQLDEEVVMQIGATSYEPKDAEHFRFCGTERYENLLKQARLVVGHAGAGLMITALKHAVPLVVVPRLKKFAEHVDDHQLELAEAMSREGRAIAVFDLEELATVVKEERQPKGTTGSNKRLVSALRTYLEQLERGKGRSAIKHQGGR